MKGTGLYIHIPFCIKRCKYCDFNTLADAKEDHHLCYIDALKTELNYYAGDDILLDTIYIGGGTPSFINSSLITDLLSHIRRNFRLADCAEITIEANPGLLDKEKIEAYLESGINRLSLGAQSMDDNLLEFLGRVHRSGDLIESFTLARKLGLKNISIDLIFAIPGQGLGSWMDTLEKITDLSPEHISFYSLQIEEGTPLHKLVEAGELKPLEEETDRLMYSRAIDILKENGYGHYEISNAAKPGHKSRHNLKYWEMEDYLGVGLGAHSYIKGSRSSNVEDFDKYIQISKNRVKNTRLKGKNPWNISLQVNSPEDEMSEYMFTGMRKVEGIYIPDFVERFGVVPQKIFKEQIEKHVKSGLLERGKDRDRIYLTPKGMDLFNMVLSDFIL